MEVLQEGDTFKYSLGYVSSFSKDFVAFKNLDGEVIWYEEEKLQKVMPKFKIGDKVGVCKYDYIIL